MDVMGSRFSDDLSGSNMDAGFDEYMQWMIAALI